ncbi:unnamed protein product, partial [Closterium sp. NIES-64]
MGSKHQLTEPAEETFESSAKHQSTVLTVGPPKSLFLALLAFRLLNSLAVQTYFNPDEFWQGPEVAHRMVFGYGYLTWEWQPEWAARSFLHPLLFAAGYRLLALLRCDTPWLVRHSPRFMQAAMAALADVRLYALTHRLFPLAPRVSPLPFQRHSPRFMQAAMAALADLRLYALTRRLFPSHPSAAAWALLCNLTCWFLLFCATRTFSNSLEASLSVIALSYWPWRHCQGDTEGAQDTGEGTQGRTEAAKGRGAEQGRGGGQLSATAQVSDLRGANRPLALALAAAACMVRPTSTPFWLPLGLHELALLLLEGTLKGGKDSSRGRWEWVRLLLLEVLPIGALAAAAAGRGAEGQQQGQMGVGAVAGARSAAYRSTLWMLFPCDCAALGLSQVSVTVPLWVSLKCLVCDCAALGLSQVSVICRVLSVIRLSCTPFWLPLALHKLALLLLEGPLKGEEISRGRGRWEWVLLLGLEVLPIGLIAVAITVAVDSWQYGQPMVFTPLNLLRFNVHLKGSSLYGSNPWH